MRILSQRYEFSQILCLLLTYPHEIRLYTARLVLFYSQPLNCECERKLERISILSTSFL